MGWEQLPASQWALDTIRSGYRLPWGETKAPLSSVPVSFPPLREPTACTALDEEVTSLLAKQAVEIVICPSSPGFYGRIFVVPKASGGWRPVLDLSCLNKFLRDFRFRMETPSSIRDAIHPQDWAVSIDLMDAYFHLLIHPRDRKFLRFMWRGMVYHLGATIRPGPCPLAFLEDFEGASSSRQGTGDQATNVPGRLAAA